MSVHHYNNNYRPYFHLEHQLVHGLFIPAFKIKKSVSESNLLPISYFCTKIKYAGKQSITKLSIFKRNFLYPTCGNPATSRNIGQEVIKLSKSTCMLLKNQSHVIFIQFLENFTIENFGRRNGHDMNSMTLVIPLHSL